MKRPALALVILISSISFNCLNFKSKNKFPILGIVSGGVSATTVLPPTDSSGPFPVRVNVSGIGSPSTPLRLSNSGLDSLEIITDGTYVFTNLLNSGDSYFVSITAQPTGNSVTCSVSGGSGIVGSGPVSGITVNCSAPQYVIQATVTGLVGSGLVLRNNGGDDLPVSNNGSFAFAGTLPAGNTYNVTVANQPGTPSQTCLVTNASGTMPAANVTNVGVNCTTNSFSVQVNVTGLTGSGFVLRNNGGDDLSIGADGTSIFSASILSGNPYSVTVLSQPTGPAQICNISGGSGTVGGGNVTGITVNCATNQYTIGVNVAGLTGSGLVLRNNGADDLSINANGAASFASTLPQGNSYSVSVFTQPGSPSQTCSVTGGSGTMPAANVSGITINCTTNTYTLSVTVTGLVAGNLSVTNSGNSDSINGINTNGISNFPTAVSSGSVYNVGISSQPTGHNCSVSAGSGTITSGSVTVTINCTGDGTPPYVQMIVPANSATGVGLNLPITVTFSESMDTATVDTNTSGSTCSGAIQLSSDNFVTCIPFSAAPAASNSNKVFTVYPASNLTGSTIYKVRVTSAPKDVSGISLTGISTQSAGFTTGVSADTTAPTVSATFPANGTSTLTFIDGILSVSFSETMNLATLTINTGADTSCSGSIQVSSDNFATCVPMISQPSQANVTSVEFRPVSNLAPLTVYKFRVTTTVQDIVGNNMAAQYESATGFTTTAGIAPVPTVTATSPANGAVGVSLTVNPVSVTFSTAILKSSITVNLGTNACSGTIQVSNDNFITCVVHTNLPAISAGQTTLLLFIVKPLANSSVYKFRITNGVTNVAGIPMASTYTDPTGFTTVP